MKIIIFLMLIGCLFANSEELAISYSGVLLSRFSINFTSMTLAGSIAEIKKEISRDIPEIRELKFSYVGTDEVISIRDIKNKNLMNFNNKTLYFILNSLGDQYRHFWVYNIDKSEIIFTAISDLENEDQRLFIITNDVSEELGLKWGSEQELLDTLYNLGWIGEVKQFDPKKRTFLAESSKTRLDFLDAIIYVKVLKIAAASDPH